MKYDELIAIQNSMHKMDKGNPAPSLGGEIGQFLRNYSLQSTEFVRLALENNAHVDRNGAIPGNSIGPITLIPLTDLSEPKEVDTNFGSFLSYTVICPELHSIIDLRTWINSGSGIAVLNILESLMAGEQGIGLSGRVLWKPPVRVNTGTASVKAVTTNIDTATSDNWDSFQFLRYAGEDINTRPYSLEYRTISVKNETLLGATRITAGQISDNDTIQIPYATSDQHTEIKIQTDHYTSARAIKVLSGAKIASLLLIREPKSRQWIVWDAIEIPPMRLLTHLAGWVEYIDNLRTSPLRIDRKTTVSKAKSSLHALGINPKKEPGAVSFQDPVNTFVKTLARRMRFSSGSLLTSDIS